VRCVHGDGASGARRPPEAGAAAAAAGAGGGAGPGGNGSGVEAERGVVLTRQDLETARQILAQLMPNRRPPPVESPDHVIQTLKSALTNQVFTASFNGNLRVLEGVLSLPAPLLRATGVHPGMQQAGTLLQPLHMASYNGHLNVVRLLIASPGVSVLVRAG